MPRLHQDTCLPATCVPDEQLVSGYIYVDGHTSPDTCCSFGSSGYLYIDGISATINYYSFMSRSTCIPLYPARDGRQTGDSFVADTRYMLTATSGYKWMQLVSGDICPGVNEALVALLHSVTRRTVFPKLSNRNLTEQSPLEKFPPVHNTPERNPRTAIPGNYFPGKKSHRKQTRDRNLLGQFSPPV